MSKKISSKTLALTIARAALEKKAEKVVIIDISDKVDYADYLVVSSGNSRRHVHTIAGEIEESMKRKRITPIGIEGESEGTWILLDYGVVVAHVFQDEVRQHYDIDGLWLDAERFEVQEKRKKRLQ